MSWRNLDGVAKKIVGTQAARIVLYLYERGPTNFRRIVKETGISSSLVSAYLKRLIDLGVVSKCLYLNKKHRWMKLYFLTDFGIRVAEAILFLQSVLYPISPSPEEMRGRDGGGAHGS